MTATDDKQLMHIMQHF